MLGQSVVSREPRVAGVLFLKKRRLCKKIDPKKTVKKLPNGLFGYFLGIKTN